MSEKKFDLGDRVRVRGCFQGDRPLTGTVIEFNTNVAQVELDEGLSVVVLGKPTKYVGYYFGVLEHLES